jgi:hypothetical protein
MLFSSIGYAATIDGLRRAINAMGRHLRDPGLLMVEPWFSPQDWEIGRLHGVFIDRPDLKLARINRAERDGDLAILNLHYLVGTSDGVEHLTERHALRLFTDAEYRAAFRGAGLVVSHDPDGVDGRGLYIGSSPTPT